MNTLVITLYALAAAASIWAVAGLISPQKALSFALPKLQSRGNAFWFPMRFAVMFALVAAGWEATDPGIKILSGLVAGILLTSAARRFIFLQGTPLQRLGIFLPSERHLFNQD